MIKFLELLQLLFQYVRTKFYTYEGLILTISISAILYYWATTSIGVEPAKIIIQLLKLDIKKEILWLTYYLSYWLIPVLFIVLWIVKRRLPRFGAEKIGILFSSQNPDELETAVKDLQSRVLSEIKSRDLLNLVEIRSLPLNFSISDHQSATQIRKKSNATLVVWGPFEKSEIESQKVIGFPKISFTYPSPPKFSMQFHKEIALGSIGKIWAYEERNEFVQKALVAENIASTALYIVGMALLAKGSFAQAEPILGVLDASLVQHRASANSPAHLREFCLIVRKRFAQSKFLHVQKEYSELYNQQGVYHATPEQLSSWKIKLSDAIKLNKRDPAPYIFMGIFLFLEGDLQEAMKMVSKSVIYEDKENAGPDFSLAFLFLYKGQFKKAQSHYRAGFLKQSSYNINFIHEILGFVEQILEKHPEKFQLHYALGLINEERLDRNTAKTEYNLFIQKASGDPAFSRFVTDVTRRVERLSSN